MRPMMRCSNIFPHHESTRSVSNSAMASFGLDQIGQIAVPVSDVERAIAFYRDTLGMRFLFQAPPGLGFFDCAGVRLMLDEPAKAQAAHQSSVIYYKVSDLRAAFETLSCPRRTLRRQAPPYCNAARPRTVDGLFPRSGSKPPCADERDSKVISSSPAAAHECASINSAALCGRRPSCGGTRCWGDHASGTACERPG